MGRIDIPRLKVNLIENPIRIQGQYEDEETGLYYNRYRYFDPNICAYVSQDPLGLLAGENVYCYPWNSFGYTDPLGLKCPETSGDKKYEVGAYKDIKGAEGLDAHHVGQKAVMQKMVKNYNPETAPAINVPKVGHTRRGPNGIVSRNTSGIENPRDLIARDIKELKRVYPDIPNSKLKEIIDLNKEMYPSAFIK